MTFKISHKEHVLVVKCVANDRQYQKMLYDRYKDAMFTLAYRITGDHDDASDALQDGFIQVFRDLKNFAARSSLGAWIKTIIVRAAYRKLQKQIITEDIEALNDMNEAVTWDDNLTGELLEKAIQSLSPGYRSVFILIEVEGYSHREVAEMLEISEGTSKSQLYYAKRKLQEYLKGFI